jgi:hypothetical protein
VRVKVRATERSPRGTVFASFSFTTVPINILTGGGYDPLTWTAELKVCPVKVERADVEASSPRASDMVVDPDEVADDAAVPVVRAPARES